MSVDRPTFNDNWHRVAALRPRLRTVVRTYRQAYRGRMWHVVDDPMPVRREVSQVVHREVHHARLDAPRDDALCERRVEHAREDRHDVELHRSVPGALRLTSRSPSGGSITTRRASTSMDTQIGATSGTSTSPSVPSTDSR